MGREKRSGGQSIYPAVEEQVVLYLIGVGWLSSRLRRSTFIGLYQEVASYMRNFIGQIHVMVEWT